MNKNKVLHDVFILFSSFAHLVSKRGGSKFDKIVFIYMLETLEKFKVAENFGEFQCY